MADSASVAEIVVHGGRAFLKAVLDTNPGLCANVAQREEDLQADGR